MTDHDVFDDSKEEVKTEETQVVTEAEDQEGEEEATPPVADKDDEKMVPVHRMKAAVKNVTEERDSLKREVEKLKGSPQPKDDDLSQILFNERTNLSRELMIETKPDYEEMEKLFADLVEEDETLAVKLRSSSNPAKFAYNTAKNHLEVQDLKKLKESDEFSEFQEWKKNKAKEEKPEAVRKKVALSVPNLTRATESKPREEDTKKDVFAGAHF